MKKMLYILAASLFLISMMLTAIFALSFQKSYYAKMYHKLNTAQTIRITEAELNEATDVLIDYIKDDRQTLDLSVSVDGRDVQMFNQKEKDHMVDVKALYLGAVHFRNIAMIFVAFMVLVSLGSGDYLNFVLSRDIWKASLLILGSVVGIVGLYALIDFQAFWISFHQLVFTNDLWLLNPNVDRLIMMVPEPFFMGLVYRIILAIGAIIAGAIAVLFGLERTVKRL